MSKYPPTRTEINTLATEKRQEFAFNNQFDNWPNCYDISEAIKDELISTYGLSADTVWINKYLIDGEYTHYAVAVGDVMGTSDTIIVDASYDQFACETDTPICVADEDNINSVVIKSNQNYIFRHYRTDRLFDPRDT